MSRLDYSKWDHIEISDDEDDTHPNIDTPSLFRWRHQARVERMEEQQKEKDKFEKGYTDHQQKLASMRKKIQEADEKKATEDLEKLKLEMTKLEEQEKEWRNKEEDLKKKERLTPWNIDTMCKDGKSKTIINKIEDKKDKAVSEDEFFERQKKFDEANEKLIKKFGMLRKYEDSQEYLLEHPHLACEETANYLVIWCVNLEVEEKSDLMSHVAHQTIVMQFILELAKSLKMDPRGCIKAFFSRIRLQEKQYMDAFNDELNSFKERVKGRAQARIQAAMEQAEEEERAARLGPGGLDPVEVFESLPKELQDCFENKDIGRLQDVLLKMPKEEAEYHMKRCVESGMWVPDANKSSPGEDAEAADSEEPEK